MQERVKRVFLYAAGLVVVGMMVGGCASRPKLTARTGLLPSPQMQDVAPMPVVRPADAGWQTLNAPLAGGSGRIVPVTDKRWADVVVYFAYDSSAIGPAERPKLETLAQHLKQYPNYAVVVEGHCDERGSDEYNRALGESRALSVRDYLTSLGIESSRIETVSYGEERLVVSGGATEAEHQKNRRAEFVIGIRQ